MSGKEKKVKRKKESIITKEGKKILVDCLVDEVTGGVLQYLNEAGIWIQVAGAVMSG